LYYINRTIKLFNAERRRSIIDKINFDTGTPIFQQIVDNILSDIAGGVLKPGDKIESVRVLAADYKVNPNTMQKSLEKLTDMGFLYTERTSGRFVTKDASKIQALKENLPAKLTRDYIKQMRDFSMVDDEILEYVQKHLKESGN